MKTRIPELDGIRGVAIAAVLAAHTDILLAGFLGVDIFFCLSGFLITKLLIDEFDCHGDISIRQFYFRRARRLFPALIVYIAICFLWEISSSVSLFTVPSWKAFSSAIFYYANWVAAFTYVPSGAAHPPLGPLAHLWSLSIEEQFYLIWPIVLLCILRLRIARFPLAVFLLCLALLAVTHRLVLLKQGVWIMRIYYGSDTRFDGLLIGCAAAFITNAWRSIKIAHIQRAAILAGWGIPYVLMTIPFAPRAITYFAFFATSFMTGIIILNMGISPSPLLQSLLRSKVAVYLGQRSYSLYIWHIPITNYLMREIKWLPHPIWALIALTITLPLAEASFRWIEQPLLRFNVKHILPTYQKSSTSSLHTD